MRQERHSELRVCSTPPNKRMKLTKREGLFEGAPSRAGIIQSRFAAYPRC